MDRKPLIAGNWKMHFNIPEAVALAKEIAMVCNGLTDREVMIAPTFLSIPAVAEAVKGSDLLVSAQNVAWGREGACTGEVSPAMLRSLGVSMAIVGHSERRQIFGEDNHVVNQRVVGALSHDVTPVLCVGETLDDREREEAFEVVAEQVRFALTGVEEDKGEKIIIAYEPVWAIGTGKTATREQAQEMHLFIRGLLAEIFNKNLAEKVRILYGGSVKPDNVNELMAMPDIDGALVGGASLKADSFAGIIKFS